MYDWQSKLADAVGSGVADDSTAPARALPVPQPSIENKPAAGVKGPSGLGGRTTYSRVNTGVPPTPDAGQTEQKALAPRGLESLPKLAEKNMTTTSMGRPTLSDLIKQAAAGAAERISLGNTPAPAQAQQAEKTASNKSKSIPTEHILKLASGLDYITRQLHPKLASEIDAGTTDGVGAGEGPGALDVSQTNMEGSLPDAGGYGSADQQPPLSPALQKDPTRGADSQTGLETDDVRDMGTYPVEPISNEKAAYAKNMVALGLAKVASDRHGRRYLQKVAFGEGIAGAGAGAMSGAGKGAGKGALMGGLGGAAAGAASGGLGGAGVGAVGGGLAGGIKGLISKGPKGFLAGAGQGALTGAKWGGGIGAGVGAGLGGMGGAGVGAVGGGAAGGVHGAMDGYAKTAEDEAVVAPEEEAVAPGGASSLLARAERNPYSMGAALGGLGGAALGGYGGYAGARTLNAMYGGLGDVSSAFAPVSPTLHAAGGAAVGGLGGALGGTALAHALLAGRSNDASGPTPGDRALRGVTGALGGGAFLGAPGAIVGGVLGATRGNKSLAGAKTAGKHSDLGREVGRLSGALLGGGAGAYAAHKLYGKDPRAITAGMLTGAAIGRAGGRRVGEATGRLYDSDDGERKTAADLDAVRAARAEIDGAEQQYVDANKNRRLGIGIGGLTGMLGGALLGGYAGHKVAPGSGLSLPTGYLGGLAGGVGGAALGSHIGGQYDDPEAVAAANARWDATDDLQEAMYGPMGKSAGAHALARNLAALGLYKQAEDAINPAQISAGKLTDIGSNLPDGASFTGDDVPAEPSDVTSQKRRMLSSNEAAINYTKRDAKADPKSDVDDVLNEDALDASTDKTLDEVFKHTDDAGAKIASANELQKVAAARSVISRLYQNHAARGTR